MSNGEVFQYCCAATLKAPEMEDSLSVEKQLNVPRQTVKTLLVYSQSAANSGVGVHQNDELNRSTVQP